MLRDRLHGLDACLHGGLGCRDIWRKKFPHVRQAAEQTKFDVGVLGGDPASILCGVTWLLAHIRGIWCQEVLRDCFVPHGTC